MATHVSPIEILGGEKTLGKKVRALNGIHARIRAGLPYASLEAVERSLTLSRQESSQVLSIPLRTLARRKREGRLSADESDRVYRAARLFGRALFVLEK